MIRWSYLRKNLLEFKDSLVDPLGNPTDELEFFQIDSSDLISIHKNRGLTYTH